MGTIASQDTVQDYMVNEMGYTRSKAIELTSRYSEIIDKGRSIGSFAYFSAGKVHRQMINDDFGGEDPPENWEGYDPNWVEPEDDEEE